MTDLMLPGLLTMAWLLAVAAALRPRRELALVGVVGGGVVLAVGKEPVLLVAFSALGLAVVAWTWLRKKRRFSPSLDELALLAEYLSNQLISGVNFSQALYQAGQDAIRKPPTLPLPVLGPHLSQKAQLMQSGRKLEAEVLRELGETFEDLTVRSFFLFLASMAQHVTQDGMANAMDSMASRVRAYRDMDKSLQARLAIARTTRYVMLILVPGLLYFIVFRSPLLEGGILNSPLGVPLLVFDGLMLAAAFVIGNWLSRLEHLEF
jgi:Flp pilus assembly protein TadB